MAKQVKPKIRVHFELAGGKELANAVNGVRQAVTNRVLRQVMRKQASKVAKIAKSKLAVKRTGMLRQSIGYVYRSYKNRTIWVYVIGPRRDKKGAKPQWRKQVAGMKPGAQRALIRILGKRRRRKLTAAQTRTLMEKYVNPSKYAHLVEGGRKAVRPTKKRALSDGIGVIGRSAKAVPARPFMAPAAAVIEQSGREIVAEVMEQIGREAVRLAIKGKALYGK